MVLTKTGEGRLGTHMVTDGQQMAEPHERMRRRTSLLLRSDLALSGASSVLVVLSLQVDYDPAGLPAFQYDLSSSQLQSQLSLWEQNRAGGQSTGSWSDGSTDSFTFAEDIGWIDNSGWVDDDGWYDDGTGWVDDDGWYDDGSGWVDDGSGWTDGGSGWVDDGSGWTDGGSGWVDNGSGWTDGGSGWTDGSTNSGSGWVNNGGWVDEAAANF